MQHPDLPSLLALVAEAQSQKRPTILVDSPPGAGKTLLIENLAAQLALDGHRVAVATPGFEQSLAFGHRFRRSNPTIATQIWIGRERRLPAGLRQDAQPGPNGSYLLGQEHGAIIQVATISKFAALNEKLEPLDFLIVDEAHQVTFSGYDPLITRAPHHVLVGDPGQLPPTVRIDTEPFETLPFRPHLPAPVEIARHDPGAPTLRLTRTYRFSDDTARHLQAFYPNLPFRSALTPAAREVRYRNKPNSGDAIDQALRAIADGHSMVAVTLPPASAASFRPDQGVVDLAAEVMIRLLQCEPVLPDGRVIRWSDIGCVEPHVAVGEAIRRRVASLSGITANTLVSTPEVWQGLERPFIVTRHPLSLGATEFDLNPGRLCVATSRHLYACILVTRDHVPALLNNARLDAGQRPLGASHRAWRGVQAHQTFWSALQESNRIFPVA